MGEKSMFFIGIGNLHPTKGAHWVTYNNLKNVAYGCMAPKQTDFLIQTI